MADYNGVQSALLASNQLAEVSFVGGRLRVFNEQVAYASQASGKTIKVGQLPKGAIPIAFIINTDTSTGSATLELGDGTTADKFAAAAAYTSANKPWFVGVQATGAAALASQTDVIATIGTAALPASGNLSVITLYVID